MVGDFLGVSETGGTDRFGDVYYNGKIHLLQSGALTGLYGAWKSIVRLVVCLFLFFVILSLISGVALKKLCRIAF